MYSLFLPYPPSVNTYWGFNGNRRYLTPKAKEFKHKVAIRTAVAGCKLGLSRIVISITLHPPDKRIRDIDNVLKPLIDALCQAGAFDDDSQVDSLSITRDKIVSGGLCIVNIKAVDPL